jgi:2-dehydro-3-deoxygluconokinase
MPPVASQRATTAAATTSVVCLGETMATLVPPRGIALADADSLQCGIGGAESNVAIGLAPVAATQWVSRLGADGFGQRILRELTANGVGVGGVEIDPERPTGLYVKTPLVTTDGTVVSSVIYYRSASAAAAMGPEFLANPAVAAVLADASLIHISGITAALSASCRNMLSNLLRADRGARRISFDVNWRPALWRGRSVDILAEMADLADVVLVGQDEAEAAFGVTDHAGLRALLPNPQTIVVKDAHRGACCLPRDGEPIEEPALRVDVVEPVGAGDAFAAGYLGGRLLGLDHATSLRRGHLSAACTLTVDGDRGPLPTQAIMDAVLGCSAADWAATWVNSRGVYSPACGWAEHS